MTPDELAQEIEQARFKPVRFASGYAMSDVDELLDELVRGFRAGRDVRALVTTARFGTVRFLEGYHREEVDAFLERVRTAQLTGAR